MSETGCCFSKMPFPYPAFATPVALPSSSLRSLSPNPSTTPRHAPTTSLSPSMSHTPTNFPDPSSHSTLRTSSKNTEFDPSAHIATKIVHAGVHRDEWTTDPFKRSVVNPPVYHCSTVTFPTVKSLKFASSDWPFTGMWYGRHGNPTTFALEEAFAAIEGADNACVTASGVAGINAAILAFVKTGDHVLITDAVYDPTRVFCDKFLSRFGVQTTYFPPTITPAQLERLIQSNTRVILVESPASLSFEVMDIPALSQVAHARDVKVLVDNTWGPSLFQPFEHGCDVSINAATKYIGGHSDLMMGIIAAKDPHTYRAVKNSVVEMGCPPGSDDAYLALRGLRTLNVRLKQHGESGLIVARWLEDRPEVIRVMHPGLESHSQHELFMKQFRGCSGLFGFQLKEGFSEDAIEAMLDGMKLHTMGFSWGGFESLLMNTHINDYRTLAKWKYGDGYGETMRIHVGLEDVNDLIKDLEEGFERLHANNRR